MKRTFTSIGIVAALAGALALSACAESRMHLTDDYGAAVKQDTLAQIANPDAKYTGDPAPGSNGQRMADAVNRYVSGKVIAPEAAHASTVGATAGSSGSSGGPQ